MKLPSMKLRVPVKLFLLVGILLVPLALLLIQFLQESAVNIEFAEKEILGVEYLRPLRQLYEHVPQHRGLTNAFMSGDRSQRDQLRAVQAAVDQDLRALEEVDLRLGAILGTEGSLEALNRAWRDLRAAVNEGTVAAAPAFNRHTQLIDEITELIRQVGDQSNLILDPDLDSYYLMDAVIIRLPEVAEAAGQLRGLGAGIAARGEINLNEKVELTQLSTELQSGVQAIERGMQVAFETNAALGERMTETVRSSLSGSSSFLEIARRQVILPEVPEVDAALFFEEGTSTISGILRLYDEALEELAGLLEARIGRLENLRNTRLAISLGLALLAILGAFLVSRGITRQVGAISRVFGQIGIGDFAARAEVRSRDELGDAANGLNFMLDSVRGLLQSQEERDAIQLSIRKLLDEVSHVADGDLTAEAEVTTDVTGAIADSFNFMISELRGVIKEVQQTTLDVGAAANEIQATAEHLSEGSVTQSEQIIDTTAAVDEMATSIQQVSDNAGSAATIASKALGNAKQGTQAVDQTIEGMNAIRGQVQETAKRIKRLGESSQEIGEIVSLISDIADRTSILALNASIQAAMAGEAGRGFAVVAEEVERLAERSAEATNHIGTLVKSIQSETTEAVSAMEATTREVVGGSSLALTAGQALGEIEGVSQQLAEVIQAISQAAKQQARGSESIAKAMGDISDVTSQTASGTSQAAVSIRKLASLADRLRDSVSRFKLPRVA